jgi:hypothetical protein
MVSSKSKTSAKILLALRTKQAVDADGSRSREKHSPQLHKIPS